MSIKWIHSIQVGGLKPNWRCQSDVTAISPSFVKLDEHSQSSWYSLNPLHPFQTNESKLPKPLLQYHALPSRIAKPSWINWFDGNQKQSWGLTGANSIRGRQRGQCWSQKLSEVLCLLMGGHIICDKCQRWGQKSCWSVLDMRNRGISHHEHFFLSKVLSTFGKICPIRVQVTVAQTIVQFFCQVQALMVALHNFILPVHTVKFLYTSTFHYGLNVSTHCCVVVHLCFIQDQPDASGLSAYACC